MLLELTDFLDYQRIQLRIKSKNWSEKHFATVVSLTIESSVEEYEPGTLENYEPENKDKSILITVLDDQDSDAEIKLNNFSTEPCSTSLELPITNPGWKIEASFLKITTEKFKLSQLRSTVRLFLKNFWCFLWRKQRCFNKIVKRRSFFHLKNSWRFFGRK